MLQLLQKVKAMLVEDLEREVRDTFLHINLKTMQDFLNEMPKCVFVLDITGDYLKCKG